MKTAPNEIASITQISTPYIIAAEEGAIEEKESRNNHKVPKLAWSILDILIRFVLKHLGAECTFIRLGAECTFTRLALNILDSITDDCNVIEIALNILDSITDDCNDLEIDSSLSSSSSLITSLLIMLVMTCTLVFGVDGLEMHLEAELHIFGKLIQSNWVVKVTWYTLDTM
ncbi:hypothetical protein GQ457_04G022930 [Hibiscus cannabinus]